MFEELYQFASEIVEFQDKSLTYYCRNLSIHIRQVQTIHNAMI